MNRISLFSLAAPLLAGCDASAPVARPDTDNGAASSSPSPPAPVTAANFLAYVDQRRFDGIMFYRAARTKGAEGKGFVQGGIRRDYKRMLTPIAHEPTSETGLRHTEGAISMARAETVGAMGDFFITANAMPQMDARADDPGFAVFGRVTEGMAIVRRILAAPVSPSAGRGAMRGQMLAEPVRIVSARRVRPQ